MDFFNFTIADFVPCEMCGSTAVDIHHIDARGMGGSKEKDNIDNLMALCRECHVHYGDIKEFKQHLRNAHALYIVKRKMLN